VIGAALRYREMALRRRDHLLANLGVIDGCMSQVLENEVEHKEGSPNIVAGVSPRISRRQCPNVCALLSIV
jgi:hypothetical protein